MYVFINCYSKKNKEERTPKTFSIVSVAILSFDNIWDKSMKFIVMDKLRKGMRLARPVYNRDGVLLYDINTKLDKQGVNSIKNFGLLGVYILEPTEPAQEMSEEDREFEKFQTVAQFSLKKQLDMIVEQKNEKDIQKLADSIIRQFGKVGHKINFNKTLRSPEDYVYKHSISVAILCALMSSQLNMSYMEQINIVTAALIHQLGRAMVPVNILKKGSNLNEEDMYTINKCEIDGNELIQKDYEIPSLTRIIVSQNLKEIKGTNSTDAKLLEGTKMLRVADAFDEMTSMNINAEPSSDIMAVRELINNKKMFDEKHVGALLKSINILVPGVCVELSNKEKGLVIKENEDNILRPVVLGFNNNEVYDLGDDFTFMRVRIFDVLKSMDNRVPIDKATIDKYIKEYSEKQTENNNE